MSDKVVIIQISAQLVGEAAAETIQISMSYLGLKPTHKDLEVCRIALEKEKGAKYRKFKYIRTVGS